MLGWCLPTWNQIHSIKKFVSQSRGLWIWTRFVDRGSLCPTLHACPEKIRTRLHLEKSHLQPMTMLLVSRFGYGFYYFLSARKCVDFSQELGKFSSMLHDQGREVMTAPSKTILDFDFIILLRHERLHASRFACLLGENLGPNRSLTDETDGNLTKRGTRAGDVTLRIQEICHVPRGALRNSRRS